MNTLTRALVSAACLLVGTLAFSAEGASDDSQEEFVSVARAWLKLVDHGEYAESWKEAAPHFQASITEANWVAAMRKVREPLGLVSARHFLDAQHTTQAPRMPPGSYWTIRFKTTFEGVTANEVVSLVADGEGKWRAVGFFIRPPT
jgi:hypothetical protein